MSLYAALHNFFHVAPILGEHIFVLPDGRTINLTLTNKGVGWKAITTLTFQGQTINIVEREYCYLYTTMCDIANDQLELVGQGILLEQLYPVKEKVAATGRTLYSAGDGLWFSSADAARIAHWKCVQLKLYSEV